MTTMFKVICSAISVVLVVLAVRPGLNVSGISASHLIWQALAFLALSNADKLRIGQWLEYQAAKHERVKAQAAADDARHAVNAVNAAKLYYWVAQATGGTYRDHPDVRKNLRNWLLRAADEPQPAEAMKQAPAWGDSSAESLRDIADRLGEAGVLQVTEVQGEPRYEVIPDMKHVVREAFG